MNESSAESSGGIGIASLLGILFIALKLTGVIHWSWLWVLAPFWIPFLTGIVILFFVAVVMVLVKDKL